MKFTDSFSRYQQTVLEFPSQGGLRIPVCEPLSTDQQAKLKALGLGDAFAVVTPCTPMGRILEVSENARRVELMQRELQSAAMHHLRADGWALDGNHVEQGFACAVDGAGAAELVRRWEQEAWWWFDGDLVELRRTA